MNEEKVNKIFCANCLEELETTDICPYCGYNPAQDDGKYPLALSHNTILNGQYIIGRVLGQGGFGITYLVKDWTTKNRMVLKEYLPNTMATRTKKDSGAEKNFVSVYPEQSENFEYGKKCFLEEAQTLAGFIGSPNIVQVHSFFEENGTAYFTMDYIEGISFQKFITDNGGKVLWQEAEKVLLPVMDALGIVHSKGFIHRDVKPDNIFITTDGIVKLLDFGAARYSLGDRTQSLDILLTHGFAPKEQYMTRSRQGPYTDVYAVAASFYYAITGIKPSNSMDRLEKDDLVAPSRLGVKIPEEVENAILKGMEVQPADRYQSMAEFKQALTMQEDSKDKGPQPSSTNADTNTVNYTASDDSKFKLKINRKALIKVGLALVAIVLIIKLKDVGDFPPPPPPPPTATPTTTQGPTTSNEPSEEKYKPVGNTANNLANGAKAVCTDDYYYVCYPGTGLSKIKKENNKSILLVEGSVSSINFDNGIVYYLDADGKACQVNADGTGQAEIAQLSGITCSMLYVMKDRFYYLRPSESGTGFDIYYVTRNDENSSPVKLANCYSINTVVFAGESLYYIAPDGNGLYKLDAASEEPENVYADACNTTMLAVENNVVYGCYRPDDYIHIWKYDTNGGTLVYYYKSEGLITGLNVYDNNIYFTVHYPNANGTPDRFCKLSSSGDSKELKELYQAKEGIELSNVSITDFACIDYTGTKESRLVISLDGNDSGIWGDDDTEGNMARSSSEGNTMGNIINNGIAAEDEQYKYYAGYDHIIRVSKDTGEEKALKNSPGFAESLNLYNGYLYYIYGDSIYQIDIEGEKNEMVLEGTGYDQMYIADGTAYIHTRFDELVCADAKNWEVRNTLSDIYDNYTISGEWVYYQNDNDYEYDFYKIKLDGTKKERLSDSLMFSPVVKDNWVYGRSTSKIFRIATDGSSEEKIYYSSNDIYRMNAGDGRIYYTEDKNKKTSVYCMNLDGTKRTKLFTEKKGTSVSHLNILKDELVFKDFEEDGIVVINMQTGDTTIYHDNDNAVENNSADDDYIFPDSDTKKLTKKMAARLSKSSVRLAINEIYARHGRRFDDENLQKYFNEKDWYIGTIDAKDFNESVFNKIEKYNIRLLNKYR